MVYQKVKMIDYFVILISLVTGLGIGFIWGYIYKHSKIKRLCNNQKEEEMKTIKERFYIIKNGEMIIINNCKKLNEGFLIYFNKKGILETRSFRLSCIDKEMKKAHKKFKKEITKNYLNDKNLERGYQNG